MEKINFITVCTEKYTSEYAEKSLSMFSRNYKGQFSPFCITDKPNELNGSYTIIEKHPLLSGWWNKLSIFGQDLPHEYTLYVDLDLLILNDLTHVIVSALSKKDDFEIACFGDHIGWMGEKFGSAFMLYKQNNMKWLYENFLKEISNNVQTQGGDQIWIGSKLSKVCYLESEFPNFVKSLKFDVGQLTANNTQLSIPKDIEKDFMLLNCHGQPKPHELKEMGWPPINEIWV